MNPKYWTIAEATKVIEMPFSELMYVAQSVHRENFDPRRIQISALLNIKTGSCPENCSYCPQSAHYNTGLKKEPMIDVESVIQAAKKAAGVGATRFCMGAAWRGPKDRDIGVVCTMISEVKKLGMETCASLGLLSPSQAKLLKDAGLDFYNHNIDTSPEYYTQIITTRRFSDRLETLGYVKAAGMKICCGGIIGMGETQEDRVKMLVALSEIEQHLESIPINKLIPIPGTPLEQAPYVDPLDFVRIIALARIMFPKSYVRLSAGRDDMPDELQALSFMAGANSIFYGEKLLTAANSNPERDELLFSRLGLFKEERNSSDVRL